MRIRIVSSYFATKMNNQCVCLQYNESFRSLLPFLKDWSVVLVHSYHHDLSR